MRIFIFTWNTQSTLYTQKQEFIKALEVRATRYDLVAIGLQEDAFRNSRLLPLITDCFSKNYELIETISLPGWGVTTYKALKNEWSYLPRGLRLAIFKKPGLSVRNVRTRSIVCPSYRDMLTFGKGAVAISLETDLGVITFINMHLPFYSQQQRPEAVLWQAKCLRYLYGDIALNHTPDCTFILGDLNFRVQIDLGETAETVGKMVIDDNYRFKLASEADELSLLLNYAKPTRIPVLSEGVDGGGPLFLPTYKLKKNRSGFRLGKNQQRAPSWCDRILYHSSSQNEIKCIFYDRWDHKGMCNSDHAAVIGEFILKR